MHEIKFNPQNREAERTFPPSAQWTPPAPLPPHKNTGVMKILFKIGILLLVAAAIMLAPKFLKILGVWGNESSNSAITTIDPNVYVALFLNNGQVYFGHITSQSSEEIVLKNVYYLQATPGSPSLTNLTPADQTRFSLIKLGQEVHGPEDILYVNRNQVLFYETLRSDSKVVQSILQAGSAQ